jgi:hypothetical protein
LPGQPSNPLTCLSLLALLTAALHAAEPPNPGGNLEWDSSYEATVLPEQDQPPWHASLGANTEASLTEGALRVIDRGTQNTELRFYSRSWEAQPREGAVAEVALKVVSCSGPAGVILLVADGMRELGLTFYPDRVAAHSVPEIVHRMDTTDDFHVYRVWIRRSDMKLWVDGKLAVEGAGKFTWEAHKGRNVFGFGSCSSPATGEALWKYVRHYTYEPEVHPVPGAKHVFVYKKPDVYACFPSFVKAEDGALHAGFGTRTRRSHIDPTGGGARMKSTDGGFTWTDTKESPTRLLNRRKDGGTARAAAYGWREVPADQAEQFEAKGYVVRPVREGVVAYLSGAYAVKQLPGGEPQKWEVACPPHASLMGYNQSSDLRTAAGVRLTAIYGRETRDEPSTSWVLRSEDDGDSWQLLPIARPVAPDKLQPLQPEAGAEALGDVRLPEEGPLGFTETAIVEAADGAIVAMLRPDPDSHGYLYQSVSKDGGKTWDEPRRTPMWGYPANLLVLRDGSLLCTYGYRRAPMGIRACLSRDNGRTWDIAHEFVLRADGQGNGGDLGYPITQQLADGQLVTVYYFTTGDGVTHIAATHWEVPSGG